jgi:signal transduction histidine kinase
MLKLFRRSAAPVLATAILAGAATVLVTVLPQLDFAYRQPELHVGLESAAALIGLLASYLLFGRFRRRRRLDDLALFIALALFALSNLFFAALPAMLFDVGSTKFSTWAAVSGRLLGAAALAVGAFAPATHVRLTARATTLALAVPVALLALTALLVGALVSSFPTGVEAELSPEASERPRLIGHPAVLVVQLVLAALFAAAAVGFARKSEREDDGFLRLLAVGSVLGAFARVNYFLYPSLYTEWIYSGDAFRFAFYVVVLAAALREISSYWAAASRAAVLDERRRIARDFHDGVAQELVFVGMNLKRLDQEDPRVKRATAGVERGLEDARRAIEALADPVDEPLDVILTRIARDVAERENTQVALALAPGVKAPADTREALSRIVAEAITNAARHGHADLVRVELDNRRGLALRITDTGTGFEPGAPRIESGGGFGLRTMRERASAVGAEFRIRSQYGQGTEVEVKL